jgi:hypothetical protein
MRTHNAWHLARISGNGLPPTSANGSGSYSLPGKSYNGLTVGGREIEADVYADGYDPAGCQMLLSSVPRIVSTDHEPLGVLRLMNAAGEWFRIPAKCVDFQITQQKRRSALCNAVFDCPYPYFESDVLYSQPLFAVEGGKEYPYGVGLDRPYTFGNITAGANERTVVCMNNGDVSAPCTFKLFGAGLSRVEITNRTTGASIIVDGMSVGGIEICTDPRNLYATFDDGSDASAYVSLFSDISAFKLRSGVNEINVKMTASSVTAAGTLIEWRGRYSTCL